MFYFVVLLNAWYPVIITLNAITLLAECFDESMLILRQKQIGKRHEVLDGTSLSEDILKSSGYEMPFPAILERFHSGVLYESWRVAVGGRGSVGGRLPLLLPVPTSYGPGNRFVSCWSFTSWQHLGSYPDGYRVVTVHTHGNFIVLSHWEISLLAS